MAKKTPKGAVKIDIGLNKSKGGIAKSAVKQDANPLSKALGKGSLMDKLASKPLKK